MPGEKFSPSFESVEAERVDITEYARPGTFHVAQDQQGQLYATNGTGDLVAGGPDSLNVNDNQDFGEILEYLVNDRASFPPSIHMGTRLDADTRANYFFKTKASLDRVFDFHGCGHTPTRYGPDPGVSLDRCIEILNPSGGDRNIPTWHDLKFSATGAFGDVDTHVETDGVREFIWRDCEFRDCDSNPILIQNGIQWNSFFNMWFLGNGAAPKIVNQNAFRVIGNSFRDTPESVIFEDCTNVIRAGNEVLGDWTMAGTSTYYDAVGKFDTINSLNERSGIDRLKYRHHAQIEAVDIRQPGWGGDYSRTDTSGSGGVTIGFGDSRDEFSTGTTTSSHAQAQLRSNRFVQPAHSFGDTPFSLSAGLSGDLDTASRAYLTSGDPSGNDYVGIVFESDTVKAAASTGGTETLQNLENPIGSTNAVYSVVFDDPSIEVYRGGDTLVGSHTFDGSETPTGAVTNVINFRLENGGNATDYVVESKFPKFVQVPAQ